MEQELGFPDFTTEIDSAKVVDIAYSIIVLSFLAVLYQATFGLQFESYLLPRMLMAATAFMHITYLAYRYIPIETRFKDRLELIGSESSDYVDDAKQLSLPQVGIELVWFGAFLVSIVVVGFFTSIFVYIALYIYVKDEPKRRLSIRNVAQSVLISLGITIFLYLLIVNGMGSSAPFRLGVFI